MRRAAMAPLVIGLALAPAIVPAQAPRTRDSAGVHIVENPSRLTHSVNLRLAEKPVYDVGGLESNPDDEFDSKQGYLRGVPLSNGGLAVIDVTRVHFFSPAGKRERIAGRKGAGPADLLYVTAICRTHGDTLAMSDSQNHRISIMDNHGTTVRTIPMADYGSAPFDACFDDGTFVIEKMLPFTPGADRTMRLTRMRVDGTVANVIGDFSGGHFDMVTQSEVSFVAVADRLYYGTGWTSEVGIYTPAGKLQTIIRTADAPQPISAADVERRFSSTIPTNVSADERSARMDRMRSMPHADTWPTYARMHVDRQGRLWVEDYRSNYPAPDGWSVFDPAGNLIGRLVLPAPAKGERPAQVIGFGDNNILLRRTDSDGAEHLTAYGILGLGPERP